MGGHTAQISLMLSTFALLTAAARAAETQGQILGCTKFSSDGTRCKSCEAGYQLVKGRCDCAEGWLKSKDGACEPGPCYKKCGQTNLQVKGETCSCDYWCGNSGTCCGGTKNKDALCPRMAATLNKHAITSCDTKMSVMAGDNISRSSFHYRPGMCWCDAACLAAGDCCATCSSCQAAKGNSQQRQRPNHHQQQQQQHRRRQLVTVSGIDPAGAHLDSVVSAAAINSDAVGVAAVDPASNIAAAAVKPAEVDVAAAASPAEQKLMALITAELAASATTTEVHDCGSHAHYPSATRGPDYVGISSAAHNDMQAEAQMQACQAADKGPPGKPIVIPVHWHAGQVCRGGVCVGGKYSAALVKKQMRYVNSVYAHVGIQFEWDGVIHKANATDAKDINVCMDVRGNCWICRQRRHGSRASINVMTSPTHIGGAAMGVTMYPSYIVTGEIPNCANFVFIYEKTMPGQGGRSQVDRGLGDSGQVLAHEIGHSLMLHHTWFEESTRGRSKPQISQQCKASSSMDPLDIVYGRSDGVRDTPAQSLNTTAIPGQTDILRFINCDSETGAYRNNTALAQQSCSSATGFPEGDRFYNNYNNLMSYGDKTCLRTLTPGQGARARCGYKCMFQLKC